MEFQQGDIVKCVDDKKLPSLFGGEPVVIGRTYTVRECFIPGPSRSQNVKIVGLEIELLASRFVLEQRPIPVTSLWTKPSTEITWGRWLKRMIIG